MADLTTKRGAATRQWDPFERMIELMGLDRLADFASPTREGGGGFIPRFEVKENRDAFIFKCDLPGVREEDIDIDLTGDRLTISGKREEEKRDESDRYYAYERSYGSFSRTFTLPEGVTAENVSADLKDGVLNVVLPKKPEAQPRRIPLTSGRKPKGQA